jgi:hypothetical protein
MYKVVLFLYSGPYSYLNLPESPRRESNVESSHANHFFYGHTHAGHGHTRGFPSYDVDEKKAGRG